MHARDIASGDFDALATELVRCTRQDGPIEVVRGHHEDLGATVLVRDLGRCMVLVDDPSCIDLMLAERTFSPVGTTLGPGAAGGRSQGALR